MNSVGSLEKCGFGSLGALVLLCVAGCSGETTEAPDDQGRATSTSTTASTTASDTASTTTSGSSDDGIAIGPPESGEVQSPDLAIEGNPDIAVVGSTLGRTQDGQIRWTFTFRNDSSEPLCPFLLSPTLLDATGTMLAGASVTSDEFAAGVPAFSGVVMGSVHSGRRADGVVFLDTCIPPGGRGLALAEVFTLQGIRPDEIEAILASAATLHHDLTPAGSSLEDLLPAPNLPLLSDLRLVETSDGRVVEGIATSSAELSRWRARFALYDANGMILDVVHAPADHIQTEKDAPVQFRSTPTTTAPTRLEFFFEESSLR